MRTTYNTIKRIPNIREIKYWYNQIPELYVQSIQSIISVLFLNFIRKDRDTDTKTMKTENKKYNRYLNSNPKVNLFMPTSSLSPTYVCLRACENTKKSRMNSPTALLSRNGKSFYIEMHNHFQYRYKKDKGFRFNYKVQCPFKYVAGITRIAGYMLFFLFSH